MAVGGRLRRPVERLAAGAPVPVFAITGPGTARAVQHLRLDHRLEVVDSPRHATVLLVAGPLPGPLAEPAARCHDALPHPRATVWWAAPDHVSARQVLPDAEPVAAGTQPAATVLRVHREVLAGSRPSEATVLPDEDPVAWRGVGPYGHGGRGMTGGHPFGRPLAERDGDLRDGLALDAVPVTFGPFLPALPAGLTLRAVLQGDVLQQVQVEAAGSSTGRVLPPAGPVGADWDAPGREASRAGASGRGAFDRVQHEPVPLAALETARARHHLGWLAEALRLAGLEALGLRALRLAATPDPDAVAADRLGRAVRRTGALTALGRGRAVLQRGQVAGRDLGPVARAAGVAEDRRAQHPAYRSLGFEPVVHRSGDTRARWEQRLAEIAQSLDLAARADRQVIGPGEPVEEPRGPGGARAATCRALLGLVGDLLTGAEWGEAVAALASLDLDPYAPAPARGTA